jgi:D-alanyl-D-alanine carboxypeptidase (penicillin-binding protein 5/6)
MLRSANDGAYAIAMQLGGSVQGFADMMNERARQIGCTNTNFHNPNGLNDDLHTTTAHDLALIGREAMKYQPFREVVRTQKYTISRSINWKDTHMVNRDKWLAKDPTAEGIKTGYTVPAGHCFVGGATRNGFRVITVVMKSENWLSDTQQMVDWAYKNFEKRVEIKAGEVVGQITVDGATIPVSAKESSAVVARKGATIEKSVLSRADAPIEKGDVVGDLVVRDSDGFEQKIPVVAEQSVKVAPIAAVTKSPASPWTLAMGSLLFVGAYFVRGRVRRTAYGTTTR